MPGSRALFYRPPFVSWVGHLSFVLRSLPLRSLRSLRETNGGYEWRTEDGTKTRQRRYEVKGTWGDDTRWTESVTPGPWSSGVVSSPHTVPFRFTVVSVPFAHSLRSSHSLHLTPSEATGTEWEGAEWGASRRRDTRRSEWEGWKACLIHVTFTPHAFHLSNSWSTAYDSLLTSLPSRHVRPFRLRSSTRPTGVSRALRASRTGSLHSAEWNGESVTAPWETNRRDREWHERLMPVLGSLTSTSLPFRPLHLRFRPGSGPVAEGRG